MQSISWIERLIISASWISTSRLNIINVIYRVSALFVLLAIRNLFLIYFESFNYRGNLVILRSADILGLSALKRGKISC